MIKLTQQREITPYAWGHRMMMMTMMIGDRTKAAPASPTA
jgi:hypothetical protein